MEATRGGAGVGKIGWLCSLVPREVVMAAGLDPVRIYGRAADAGKADAFFCSNVCPHLKNILASALTGKFDELSGVILTSTCDGTRRLHDLWQQYVPGLPAYMLEVPRRQDADGAAYFAHRLAQLAAWLAAAGGTPVTEAALRAASRDMNRRRRLVGELFAAQRDDPVPRRGDELWTALHQEAALPGAAAEELLRGLPRRSPGDAAAPGDAPRLLLLGSVVNRPDLFAMVAAAGGTIVAFDTCEGLRHYEESVPEDLPPLEALARRYLLLRPTCPGMPGFAARLARLRGMVRDFRIQGVMYSSLTSCDFGMFEIPQVERFLASAQLPFLAVEDDYLGADRERARTRVEAFLELVRAGLP
jgi:benzoyl-CoA reductase subunit C